MKRNRTLSSISGSKWLLAGLALLLSLPLSAQAPKAGEFTDDGPLYRGVTLKLDVAGQVGKFIGSDYSSMEGAVSVNLKNRFFPTFEAGYGSIDTTDDENDIHYKSSSPYYRIGADYNMMWKRPYLPGRLTVGLRYGFTSMTYDVEAPALTDPNWAVDPVTFTYQDQTGTASWLEVVIGVECRVYKRFHMGWNLRYRSRLTTPSTENVEPHYIPGFGKNKKTGLGVCYNLIYELPF
jgi:hypothetical protein